MDAKIKKIQINPATFDDEGEIKKEESATLTFEVPLDGLIAQKEVIALFEVLTREYVTLSVENQQLPIKSQTKSATITKKQVGAQLETIEEMQ